MMAVALAFSGTSMLTDDRYGFGMFWQQHAVELCC